MNTGRGRAAIVIAAIALGSAIAGAGIDRWAVTHGPRRRPSSTLTPEQAAKRRAEMLEHMTKDLSLSPTQRVGIDSILQRTDSTLRAVRSEMQPRLRAILDGSRAQIAVRLDSAQRVKFEAQKPPRRAR